MHMHPADHLAAREHLQVTRHLTIARGLGGVLLGPFGRRVGARRQDAEIMLEGEILQSLAAPHQLQPGIMHVAAGRRGDLDLRLQQFAGDVLAQCLPGLVEELGRHGFLDGACLALEHEILLLDTEGVGMLHAVLR